MEILVKVREIVSAEQSGDPEHACRLYDAYPEVLQSTKEAAFRLQRNAAKGRIELVIALLDRGVDVNVVDPEEFGASRAIAHAASAGKIEVVMLLIERGSDLNWSVGGRPPTCVPLSHAILGGHDDVARVLIDAGAILNNLDNTGSTPLDWATRTGRTEVAHYLRSKGALTAAEVRAKQSG